MKFYPLKFQPIFHYRIWGGDKLKTVFHKEYNEDSIGESWEISAVPKNETTVVDGIYQGKTINELIHEFKGTFLGEEVYKKYGDEFPILIKFIDAQQPLSIQVHPNNDLARKRHNCLGKNEMWYIMPSDQDAKITVGFKEELNKETYQSHLKNNTITDTLNEIAVKAGDAFYIPTGRVHAIGAGVVLAEIQQSSDVTYRIYDYDRKDIKTGANRELHTDLALDAIDFELHDTYQTNYTRKKNFPNKLIDSPYFKTNFLKVKGTQKRNLSNINSFVIYMCVKGSASFVYEGISYSIKMGECTLLPSGINSFDIEAISAQFIEIYL